MTLQPKFILSVKTATARSCSAKKKPRNLTIMSTMSPNDQLELSDVNGIQAVSEARKHPPHIVLLNLGLSVIVVKRRDPAVTEQKARE